MTKLSAIAIYSGKQRDPGACEIYRGNMPLHFLGEKGDWRTAWTWFDILKEGGGEALYNVINSFDVFIFPRMQVKGNEGLKWTKEFFDTIRSMGHGKKIVYEVDDDYTNEFRFVTPAEAIKVAEYADAITVTTPYLKRRMEEKTGRPAYVLPNCVAPSEWFEGDSNKRKPGYKDKVVIGLTGSPTHKHDWEVLETVMPKIMKDYPNALLLSMGYTPPYLENLPNTKYIPPVSYNVYCEVIRGCDIILAPVDPNDGFNLGKSPIKAVEGMAATRTVDGRPAGAAVIATNNPIYSLAVTNNRTGLLVDHTPEQWEGAIRELLDNPDKRKKLQFQGNKFARLRYDISKEWIKWDRAYRTILDQ